jgi:PAS domain S-box-containing protein
MRFEIRERWMRYALALSTTVAAFLLTAFITPLERQTPAALFYLAVLVSAVWGGVGPGLVASASGAVAVGYFVTFASGPPEFLPHALPLAVFCLVASTISWLSDARRRAAEAERLGRERLRVMLESIGDAVVATDTGGRVTFLNPVAQALTGWAADSALGQPLDAVFRILNEHTRAAVESPVTKVLREGTIVGLANHTVLLARDGREWPIDDSGAPIKDGDRLAGVVLVFRDISEKKAAERERENHLRLEQELRRKLEAALVTVTESEERFRTMADGAPVMLWMSAPDTLCTFFNRPWLEFTGRSLDEERGNGWAEGVHPEDFERCLDTYLGAFEARKPFSMEYRLRRADGEYRSLLDNGAPRFDTDGAFVGYVGSCVDITERKAAEAERVRTLEAERAVREQAERASRRLRSLQHVADAALAHLTLDRLIGKVHERIREVLQVDTVAILLREGNVLVARAAKGLEEEVEQGVRIPVGCGFAGRVAAERRTVVVDDLDRADIVNPLLGEKGIRSLVGAPLVADGEVIGVLHAGSFAPARFTDEDALLLRLAADRVAGASAPARLYEAERTSRERAEAANRAKDEFLATLSHELRTPLNAMLGWTRLLCAGTLDDATARRGLEVIERNTRAQTQLIEDLLDVSRIISGKLRLEMRMVEISSAVSSAVESVRPAAEAKRIRIDVRVDDQASQISGDPNRLQQIVWNLLANAVKFTPKGGQVDVVVERINSHMEIKVTDTGAGIGPHFLPHVFERFRQADSSTTRSHGGLGLGLAIVRHLVEMHGGIVYASSDGEGRGSTFTVRLPVVALRQSGPEDMDAAEGGSSRSRFEPARSLEGVRILAVDDEADARDLLRIVLEQCGAEVVTASTAAECLAALETWTPDVVVSDIGMPGEDGYALIAKLRAIAPERGGSIPAVALTAYARSEDRVRLLSAGFQSHVVKPADPAELVAVVASLAGKAGRSSSA